MTEQQPSTEIEATGNIKGSVATVEAKLGAASMTLTADLAPGLADQADLLLQAFPAVVEHVLDNLIQQSEAAGAGQGGE